MMSANPGLLERLCRSLAFHIAETELTVQHVEGDVTEWRDEIEAAKALIAEAGFDYDTLYPPADRPTTYTAPH